jgi:hypothetical protein
MKKAGQHYALNNFFLSTNHGSYRSLQKNFKKGKKMLDFLIFNALYYLM